LLDGLDIGLLVAALGAGYEGELLFFGKFGGGNELPNARGIGGDWLFGEDVLAGFHGGFDVHRARVGRCAVDDDINIGLQQFFIGIQADEAHVVLDVYLGLDFGIIIALHFAALVFELIFKNIGQRHNFYIIVPVQAVENRAAAASAAPD